MDWEIHSGISRHTVTGKNWWGPLWRAGASASRGGSGVSQSVGLAVREKSGVWSREEWNWEPWGQTCLHLILNISKWHSPWDLKGSWCPSPGIACASDPGLRETEEKDLTGTGGLQAGNCPVTTKWAGRSGCELQPCPCPFLPNLVPGTSLPPSKSHENISFWSKLTCNHTRNGGSGEWSFS